MVTNPSRVAARYLRAQDSFPEMQRLVDKLHAEGVIDYPIKVAYFGPVGRGMVSLDLLKNGENGNFAGRFMTSRLAYGFESPSRVQGVSKECLAAYKKVRRKHRDAELWTVAWAFLNDKRLWGQGVGRLAYEKILHDAGSFEAVVVPHWCAAGGSTSPMAQRVWTSISKRHTVVGDVVIPNNMR
jgi:hypothetical protein